MSASPEGDQPLVSIIVPTFNRAALLERCVHSILGQSYRHLECLVMDGSSTDGSVEMLRRIASQDPRLRFISEPDKGEVDAVNKGLDKITGDVLGIQASDDYYVPDAVASAVTFLKTHPEFIGVGGDTLYVDPSGKPLGRGACTYRGELGPNRIRQILVRRFIVCPVMHGTFFGWRQQLARYGKFDPEFSVVSDVEYYLRVISGGGRIASLRRVQSYYTLHAEMGAMKHYHRVREQLGRLYKRYDLKWYHHLGRLTIGRGLTYICNPYRSPFFSGLARELKEFWVMRQKRANLLPLAGGFFDC